MSTRELEVVLDFESSKAADYLQDLSRSLRAGRIVLSRDAEHVELTPTPQVTIGLKAKQKKGRSRFSLTLEWYDLHPAEETTPATISSDLPREPAVSVAEAPFPDEK